MEEERRKKEGETDGHQKEGEDEYNEEEEKRDGDGVKECEGGTRVRRW